MDKETIIRNFSKYAHTYDTYAHMQRKTACQLLGRIRTGRFKRILELGCGTGNYTLMLRERFKDAQITAVDISERMTEVARHKLRGKGITFIVADAEDLALQGGFDLITAHACLHWFDDMKTALTRYKYLLGKNGIILFSLFGPQTFCELQYAVRQSVHDGSVPAAGFMRVEEVKRIFAQAYTDVRIKEMTSEESFACLADLLKAIKYTGTRGEGLGSVVSLDRGKLHKIEASYLNKFHAIKASYQVFFCRGRRG